MSRPRILLTGATGQVGWELQRTLNCLGEVVALDSKAMNLADADAVRQTVRDIAPGIIVNPAAYTAVDKAEGEPDLARAVNAVAPGILAEEAGRLGALLVHYSTDYVFNGSGTRPGARTMPAIRSTCMARPSWQASAPSRPRAAAISSSAPPGYTARAAAISC